VLTGHRYVRFDISFIIARLKVLKVLSNLFSKGKGLA